MTNSIYNFSNPELNQRTDKLILSYNRDQNAFETYGYNSETICKINELNEKLKIFPSDDHYQGLMRIATDKKNAIRSELELNIVDVRNRAKLVYGEKSIDYKLFKFQKLSRLNDNELVQYALHVINTAEPRLEALSKRMVTQSLIDNIAVGRTKLDDCIDQQASSISERREKKLERTILGNELYQLLSELCEVGKLVWKGKNEAYYTDYVIYGSSKPLADQAEDSDSEEITEDEIVATDE